MNKCDHYWRAWMPEMDSWEDECFLCGELIPDDYQTGYLIIYSLENEDTNEFNTINGDIFGESISITYE